MPNDLSTLNGSLVEMKDQLIYELGQKGVTASYDSTTGLLGLIGKISEIQQGGSCYHIEFSEDSYTATGGAVTLECTLQQNYAPLANVTVSLTDGSSVYSSITNQYGVATFSLTGLTSSGTYTCSYSNVSDTCTVNVVTYYFIDDCSADNSSNYTSISLRNTSGTASITYDSNRQAYAIKRASSGVSMLQLGDTTLQNNMKISADMNLNGSSWANNGFICFADKDNPKTYSVGGFAQGETYYRLVEFNGSSEVQTTTNSRWGDYVTNDYNHHELIYQDGVVTYTITTPNNVSKTLTLTLRGNNYIGGAVGLFLDNTTGNPQCYVKNIKAEPI